MARSKYLIEIPRKLNNTNIKNAIDAYLSILSTGPVQVVAETPYAFLKTLKRKQLESGPYPGVSLFEAANRIMSDLVILFGVKLLLHKTFDGISFSEFTVQLGNENDGLHDLVARLGNHTLHGEAFNVAESFFYLKKRSSLEKLSKTNLPENHIQVLLYNVEATITKIEREDNLFYLPVHIEL
jgi:hypothetical protein